MSEFILQEFDSKDTDAIVQLWYDTWHETFPHLTHPDSINGWKHRFETKIVPTMHVVVAKANSVCIGFMALDVPKHYLSQIFVDRRYHRSGVGGLLIEQAKSICPAYLSLHTLQSNTKACKFYEKHGFIQGEEGVNPVNGQANIAYHWHSSEAS